MVKSLRRSTLRVDQPYIRPLRNPLGLYGRVQKHARNRLLLVAGGSVWMREVGATRVTLHRIHLTTLRPMTLE